jgi:hypothetical protein
MFNVIKSNIIKHEGGAKKYVKQLHSLREYSYIIAIIFIILSRGYIVFDSLFYYFYQHKLALILFRLNSNKKIFILKLNFYLMKSIEFYLII